MSRLRNLSYPTANIWDFPWLNRASCYDVAQIVLRLLSVDRLTKLVLSRLIKLTDIIVTLDLISAGPSWSTNWPTWPRRRSNEQMMCVMERGWNIASQSRRDAVSGWTAPPSASKQNPVSAGKTMERASAVKAGIVEFFWEQIARRVLLFGRLSCFSNNSSTGYTRCSPPTADSQNQYNSDQWYRWPFLKSRRRLT